MILFQKIKFRAKGSTSKGLIALSVVSIVWGTTWVVSKQAVANMPPLQMAGIRQILGGFLFLFYFILKRYPLPQVKDIWPLIVLSILNFVMSNGLSTWGVKYISAGLAAIIGTIFPLWLVIFGLIVDRTKPPKMAILGLIIGFLGICVIFYEYLADFINPDFRFGIFLSLTATFSWALGTLMTKKHAKIFNPYFGLGFQMLLAGLLLSLCSWIFDTNYLPWNEITPQSWYAILYLVIFGSIIGFGCYLYALQHLPTTQTSIYAYINPIVALLTGWVILHEPITVNIMLGCLITISGIYLVNRSFTAVPTEKIEQ